jgi:hypothetical protein
MKKKKQLIKAIINNEKKTFDIIVKNIEDVQFENNLATTVAMEYGRLDFLKVLMKEYNTIPNNVGGLLCKKNKHTHVLNYLNKETGDTVTTDKIKEQLTENTKNISANRNYLRKHGKTIKSHGISLNTIEINNKQILYDSKNIIKEVQKLVDNYRKNQKMVEEFEDQWKKTVQQESKKLKEGIQQSKKNLTKEITKKMRELNKKNKKTIEPFLSSVEKRIDGIIDNKLYNMYFLIKKLNKSLKETNTNMKEMGKRIENIESEFKKKTKKIKEEVIKQIPFIKQKQLDRINEKLGFLTEYALIEHLKRIIEKEECVQTFEIHHSYTIPINGDQYFHKFSTHKYNNSYFKNVFGKEFTEKMTPSDPLEIDYIFYKDKKVLSIIEITTKQFGHIKNEKITEYPKDISKNFGMRKFIDKMIQIERILHFLKKKKTLCRVYLITVGEVFNYKRSDIKNFMANNKQLFPNIYELYSNKKFAILGRKELKY